MVETDIASCLEAIPHDRLTAAVEERIIDRHVLKLLRSMLSAGVLVDGEVRRSGAGTPQGGVISPVLRELLWIVKPKGVAQGTSARIDVRILGH